MSPKPLLPASSLRMVLILVVTAASLVMGMAAITTIVRLDPAPWLAASLATAAMCGLTVRQATRKRMVVSDAVWSTIAWALLLGVVNGPVSFLAASAVERMSLDILALLPFVAVIGSPFGLGFGLLFGLALSVPVATFMRAWQRPSPDTTDTSLAIMGLWLALAAGLVVLVLAVPHGRPALPHGMWGASTHQPWRGATLFVTAWVMGAAGVGLAVVAGLRRAARHRFVTRVALGLVPGWRMAPADPSEGDQLAGLPCLGETQAECDHLLLRCEQPGAGAYRRAKTEWPVAWVPSTWLDEPPRSHAAC